MLTGVALSQLAPAESDKGDPASGPSGNGNAGQKGREQSKITNGSSGSSGGAGSGGHCCDFVVGLAPARCVLSDIRVCILTLAHQAHRRRFLHAQLASTRTQTHAHAHGTLSLSQSLACLLACSRACSLTHSLTHFCSLFLCHFFSLSSSPVASTGEARIVKRSELRGRSLLKHVRWPEYQREGLSEMFVCPDPAIGHLIQTMLIEALGVCVSMGGKGGGGVGEM